jgi:hypothetical protein
MALSVETAPGWFINTVREVRKDENCFQKWSQDVQDHYPRRWPIVAIAVGALIVVGFGGFGGIGLLHSYGVIGTFPPQLQWLSSAIGTIGNTPHFWSLWVLTGGGIAVGAIPLVLGARALKRANRKREEIVEEQKEFEAYKALFEKEFIIVEDESTREQFKGDGARLKIDKGYYRTVWYDPKKRKNDGLGDERYQVIILDDAGILKSSVCVSEQRQDKLVEYVQAMGFQDQAQKK